jgi:hypothetical protein
VISCGVIRPSSMRLRSPSATVSRLPKPTDGNRRSQTASRLGVTFDEQDRSLSNERQHRLALGSVPRCRLPGRSGQPLEDCVDRISDGCADELGMTG